MAQVNEKLLKDYELHCQRIAKATTVNINESAKQKMQRMKKLESDYSSWFEYYFPDYAKSPCAWYHKRMANVIINNPVVNLLLPIFRSGAKSVHADMGTPLFLMLAKKDLAFMLQVGETETKSCILLSDIQAQLKFNQRIINDYGKHWKYGDWSNGNFTTTTGVHFHALGVGQSPRGVREMAERPDYISVDDIDSKERCNNERRSRQALEWVWEDLKGTFDEGGKRQRFVVANNNFHKNTVINQLCILFKQYIKEAKSENRPINHYIIEVNAVKDLHTFEPNWPEKTTAEYWKLKFSDMPYRSFMREYMNTHIQDGSVFKADHIQYSSPPRIDSFDGLVLYGDLSYKENADYKALVLAGKKDKDFFVIEAFVRQTSRNNCAIWLYDLYESRNLQKYNIKYLIEGLFAQDEFVNDFDEEGRKRGYYIPVVADQKTKINKFDRIESMAGHFERGTVFFNDNKKESTDFITLTDQLLAFEKGSGAHDDGPDALQAAIAELNRICFVEKFEPRILKRSVKTSKHRY